VPTLHRYEGMDGTAVVTGWPDWLEGRLTVTVQEAAAGLGVHERTVTRWMHDGVLEWVQPGGEGRRGAIRLIKVESVARLVGVPTGDTADTPEGTEGE
jgi:excisionase family DNA binding protein